MGVVGLFTGAMGVHVAVFDMCFGAEVCMWFRIACVLVQGCACGCGWPVYWCGFVRKGELACVVVQGVHMGVIGPV